MRRSFVLLLFALNVLAGSELSLPGASGADRGSMGIICPLTTRVIIPCCEPPPPAADHSSATSLVPPQPICCPGNALCISSVTINSTPNPSHANGKVTISGQVLRTPVATTRTVVLWQLLPGQKQFTQVVQTSADANGKYTVTRRAKTVRTNRQWYATVNGLRSPIITQGVEAAVTLKATPGRRHLTNLSGGVSPSHKGQRVRLQREGAHGWVTIARPRLTRASRFALARRLAGGTVKVRVLLPADRENVLSLSPTVTVNAH